VKAGALGAVLPATLFAAAFALCWLGDTMAEGTAEAEGNPDLTVWSTPIGDGFLSLETIPRTVVSENGVTLGWAPIVRLALAPGTHTLCFEDARQGIRETFSVAIESGKTVSMTLGLESHPAPVAPIPITALPLAPAAVRAARANPPSPSRAPARAGAPADASRCTIRAFVDESGIKRFAKECP
jgi:hypothetical protein